MTLPRPWVAPFRLECL